MVSWEKDTLQDRCVFININNSSHFLCKDRAQAPDIMISGNMKVGQTVTVQCSVYHTCPTYPPTLSLNIPLHSASLRQSTISDGTSKTTLTSTMFIERDHQTVECSVRHKGGITATAFKALNAECKWWICKTITSFLLCWRLKNVNIYHLYLRLLFTIDYQPDIIRISWGTGEQSNLHCLIHMPKTCTSSHMELC